jgi:hypothetical protein
MTGAIVEERLSTHSIVIDKIATTEAHDYLKTFM